MIASNMRLLSSSAAVLASSCTLKIASHGRWSTETVTAHVRWIASCGKDCYSSGEYNYAAMASIFLCMKSRLATCMQTKLDRESPTSCGSVLVTATTLIDSRGAKYAAGHACTPRCRGHEPLRCGWRCCAPWPRGQHGPMKMIAHPGRFLCRHSVVLLLRFC